MMEAVAALAGILAGALACLAILRLRHSGALRSGEELLETSRREAEDLRRETEIRLKDEEIRRREELERQADRMREEWEEHERRMSRKEALFDRKFEVIGVKENHLEEQARRQQARQEALDLLEADRRRVLEETKQGLARVSGLSREQAAEAFIQGFEDEMREECASRIRRMQERAEEEAEMRAQKILGDSVQRLALSYCAESVTSTVVLPNDDMKGRIIGREGRNIRAIEKNTGADLIIDDTPGVVVISCFDNVRREVARRSIERLVADGRIHPGRIEETVALAKREIEDDIRQTGRKVLHELDIARVDPRIQYCVGRLKYRSSYGQNQLKHAVEVAYLAAAIAAEMKLNPALGKRCGILHDIGKALDHELEGGHPAIGADLARRCGERPEVVNAVAAHHGGEACESVYAVVVQVADAISAARPGARRDTMDRYIQRLEKLEEIATSFPGVESAFAIQAGREVRVVVDAAKVDDATALVRAREIARRVESELIYPGEVKVTIIRETRVTEYAR